MGGGDDGDGHSGVGLGGVIVDGAEGGADEIEDGVEGVEEGRLIGFGLGGRQFWWIGLEVDGMDGAGLVFLE